MDGMAKIFALIMLAACVGCGCPSNPSGETSTAKYTVVRDLACDEVLGCDRDYMKSVPLYESDDPQRDGCEDGAIGCFCTDVGCNGAILISDKDFVFPDGKTITKEMTALHEYVHAAFHAVGDNTYDHPPRFAAALQRAYTKLKALEQK